MIQALEVDFKSTAPDGFKVRIKNGVAFFRYDLEGSLNSKCVVDVHQRFAEVATDRRFYIVGNYRSDRVTLGPKPYKGKPIHLQYLHCEDQESFEKHIDTAIDGPRRERNSFPIAQIDLL